MARYDIADVKLRTDGKRTYTTVIPPTIERDNNDIYVITQYGDRLDLIAADYYNDATKWYIIAAANPNTIQFRGSLALQPGTQVRIPINTNSVDTEYINQNLNR
jgi:hypothetical protein